MTLKNENAISKVFFIAALISWGVGGLLSSPHFCPTFVALSLVLFVVACENSDPLHQHQTPWELFTRCWCVAEVMNLEAVLTHEGLSGTAVAATAASEWVLMVLLHQLIGHSVEINK